MAGRIPCVHCCLAWCLLLQGARVCSVAPWVIYNDNIAGSGRSMGKWWAGLAAVLGVTGAGGHRIASVQDAPATKPLRVAPEGEFRVVGATLRSSRVLLPPVRRNNLGKRARPVVGGDQGEEGDHGDLQEAGCHFLGSGGRWHRERKRSLLPGQAPPASAALHGTSRGGEAWPRRSKPSAQGPRSVPTEPQTAALYATASRHAAARHGPALRVSDSKAGAHHRSRGRCRVGIHPRNDHNHRYLARKPVAPYPPGTKFAEGE